MAATSARNLMAGSGTVSTASNSRLLTFSGPQAFKEGATVILSGGQKFTIDVGSGTTWTAIQTATSTVSGQTFTTTDTGTTRARGASGQIIPAAMHFLYRAPLDSSGNSDWYFYFDTVFPESGVHPYTKDQYTGTSWVGAAAVQALVPNLGLRIRVLEGLLRAPGGSASAVAGTTLAPDARLSDLIARVVALETWANSTGHFGTPPAIGTNPSYTVDDLQGYGDIA